MKDKDLLKRLRKLGFPLFETEEAEDANLTLADVVESKDLRFWEGFPVVLAASAEKGLFDYNKVTTSLKKPFDKPLSASLVAMSLALYKHLDMKFSWTTSLYNSLNPEKKKELEELFLIRMELLLQLPIMDCIIGMERLLLLLLQVKRNSCQRMNFFVLILQKNTLH